MGHPQMLKDFLCPRSRYSQVVLSLGLSLGVGECKVGGQGLSDLLIEGLWLTSAVGQSLLVGILARDTGLAGAWDGLWELVA